MERWRRRALVAYKKPGGYAARATWFAGCASTLSAAVRTQRPLRYFATGGTGYDGRRYAQSDNYRTGASLKWDIIKQGIFVLTLRDRRTSIKEMLRYDNRQ